MTDLQVDPAAMRHLAEAQVNVELDTGDMILNLGPQHPATHGTLRLVVRLDGERVVSADPVIGYMHRGYEKLTEFRTYPQITTLINRIDWLSSFANEVPFILAAEKLMEIVPDSNRQPYDMYDLITEIVDDGVYFDIKPKFAKTIITCLARFGGMPCGIVANQPKQLGGILENDSADKAARFVNLCDAFNIPLLFLQDVPGFMVGSKVEHAGIIRHGAKMLYAVSRATVPKITVVVRKAYGAGYYVMNGKAYEPDLIVAWPSAEISVMGAEGAVNIIGRSAIEASDDPEKTRNEMLEGIRKTIDPYIAARNALIDDIIDPRETRPTIINGLRMAKDKRVDRPWKKHGVMPV